MENHMRTTVGLEVIGFLKIYDPNSKEVLLDKKNAIHYENISEAMALTLSNRGYGSIFKMAFGNGGASVNEPGIITYLPPNTAGQNAALYNQTYEKIIDDTLIINQTPTVNKMSVNHISGKYYTDILIQCFLDYGEPADGLSAFDNETNMESQYTFDELGILASYGTDEMGETITKLLTHVIFHPIQKSLNRQIQIDYTIRIQSLTNMVTI